MKKSLLIAISMSASFVFAQTTDLEAESRKTMDSDHQGWKKGGKFSILGTQTHLTNWIAGGFNSITLNTTFNLYANYRKDKSTWENRLDFGYGLLRQANQIFADNGEKWIKTDDRLELFSKYGRRINDAWSYAGALNFRTQTTAGYAYPDDTTEISGFMAPGYLIGALGWEYKPKTNEDTEFSLFLAPVTTKMTFVNDTILANAGSFGVDEARINDAGIYVPGKRFRDEYGGYIRAFYKHNFGPLNADGKKHMSFTTKLDLFSNYLDGHPERIDVFWDNIVSITLGKREIISLEFITSLIYDDDIDISVKDADGVETANGPRVQFKEFFGVGLTYNFEAK